MKRKQKSEPYAEEIRILRNAMLNHKLVVFVGAGTSLDAGMPSWGDAVKKIAERLGVKEQLDYMKIPQYYYNARGKKEYVELMREIFKYGEELDVQEVHRNIIRLNAHTIITTNYDCLIEKAASKEFEFMQIISQDNELPYKHDGKLLLKMHGDFQHDNFVLKEDDYQQYSKNFKLMDAYIKSLLATNVVLFIGYSFSDPDVKQIFSWVKEILGEDLQRAYMLNVTNEFEPYEFDYYNNWGINVIYASELEEEFKMSDAYLYTNKFLERILEEEQEDKDLLYMECKTYCKLNYISSKYVQKLVRKCGAILKGTAISPQDCRDKEANKLWEEIACNKVNDERLSLLNEVLSKSAAKQIEIYDTKGKNINKKEIGIDKKSETLVEKLTEMFDFEGLKALQEENEFDLSEETPELYLEQAYISYILGDGVKAYRYLHIASDLFFRKKNYIWHFLSEVNQKNIGKFTINGLGKKYNPKELIQIKKETDRIDVEKLYKNILIKEENDIDFLQEIYTFKRYFSIFQEIYRIGEKTQEEAGTVYEFYSGEPGYEKLRENVKDCYAYDLQNYIMTDRYKEVIYIYRTFSRYIIESACNNLNGQIPEDSPTTCVYVENLEKFDVYITLRYMSQKDLLFILNNNCKCYIDIDEEANEYLKEIVFNISKIDNYQYMYLNVYLTLIAFVKLDEELVANVLEVLEDHADDVFITKNFGMIIKFLKNAEKQKVLNKTKHASQLEKLIEQLIKNISEKKAGGRSKTLLSWYLKSYKKINSSYYSKTLLELAKTDDYAMLAKIYQNCDERICKEIESTCTRWNWTKDINQFQCYKELVLQELIPVNQEIEEEILKKIDTLKMEGIIFIPDTYESTIQALAVLYINDKICMRDQVKECIQKSGNEILKWLVDTDEYDYKKFDLSWLGKATDSLLESLAKSEKSRRQITKCIKNAYLDSNLDKDILDKYFEFFVEDTVNTEE